MSETLNAIGPHAGLLFGKVVIVTGASAGIGAGLCAALAGMGARVAGMARRFGDDGISSLEPGKVSEIHGDVADQDDCERVVQEVLAQAGRVDVLINNAGSMGANPIASVVETSLADFDKMFAINVRGPFLMARAVIPAMAARQDGLIVNLSSFAAVVGIGHMAVYGASKAALMQLSNTIAVEWGQQGVRSVSIVLGGVATQMTEGTARGMYRLAHGPDAEYVPPEEPSAGMLSLEDLGLAVGALCSPMMKIVNGTAVAMDSNVSAGSLSSMFVHMLSARDA